MKRLYDHVGGFGHLLIMGQAGFLEHDETVLGIRTFAREVYPRIKQEFPDTAVSGATVESGPVPRSLTDEVGTARFWAGGTDGPSVDACKKNLKSCVGPTKPRASSGHQSGFMEAKDQPACRIPVRLHRVLPTAADKVFRAFLEADALAKWLPPNGFACTVHHLEPRVGGKFKMSFRNFTTGKSHAFGGEYVELLPGERVRYTDKFDDPNLPDEMHVTVTLTKVSVGTQLEIVQTGVPDLIPPEACYLGWQELLRNLARLVEPEIKD